MNGEETLAGILSMIIVLFGIGVVVYDMYVETMSMLVVFIPVVSAIGTATAHYFRKQVKENSEREGFSIPITLGSAKFVISLTLAINAGLFAQMGSFGGSWRLVSVVLISGPAIIIFLASVGNAFLITGRAVKSLVLFILQTDIMSGVKKSVIATYTGFVSIINTVIEEYRIVLRSLRGNT